jgi:beta-galactosidase
MTRQVSSTGIYSWVLKNPTSGTTFTVLQQDKTGSTANVTASATLSTSAGDITVGNVSLYGRQSKILVTDYTFGSHQLLYSSADILTSATFGNIDVIVFYLKPGQVGEFALKGDKTNLTYNVSGISTVTSTSSSSRQVFRWTQAAGITTISVSNGVLVYLLDQTTAWRFWAPSTTISPASTATERLFILGPYLVRNASVSQDVLRIVGDGDDSTTVLEAYVGTSALSSIEWNGVQLAFNRTDYGAYRARIPSAPAVETVTFSKLDSWWAADSLPETAPAFDDSKWVVCNKTSTLSPLSPQTLPVLFSSDYGFYVGAKIYRGYFDVDSSSAPTAVSITAAGGLAFGWNAWLNGVFLGGHAGNATANVTTATLTLPSSGLRSSGSNVLTVLVDYHGHDETSTAYGVENPRGLLGARLVQSTRSAGSSTGFREWRVQGNAGGAAGITALDPVRGPMNEGGLYAERAGWPLPGFDAARSPAFKPSAGPTADGLSAAGVRFYVTNFTVSFPTAGLDVPLGIRLSAPSGTVARALLWVNGYQYGKYIPHIGPQTRFPVPPGVIDGRAGANNTLAVALWAQTTAGARLDAVEVFAYAAYTSGFAFDSFQHDWIGLRPPWSIDRTRWV